MHSLFSGCSAARLARVVRDDEVGGSNPLTPTTQLKPASLAQLVERFTRNEQVAGSSPAGGSPLFGFIFYLDFFNVIYL